MVSYYLQGFFTMKRQISSSGVKLTHFPGSSPSKFFHTWRVFHTIQAPRKCSETLMSSIPYLQILASCLNMYDKKRAQPSKKSPQTAPSRKMARWLSCCHRIFSPNALPLLTIHISWNMTRFLVTEKRVCTNNKTYIFIQEMLHCRYFI